MLRLLAPQKLLRYSILIWLIVYITIPTTYLNIKPIFFPLLILISYISVFVFGMYLIRGDKKLIIREVTARDRLITYLSIALGFFGTLLKTYQRFIQQGYLFAEDYTKLRIELMEGELNSGFLGLLTALTTPFGLISFLIVLYFRKQFSKTIFLFTFLLALYPIFESYFTQGRMIIVIVVSMILITLFFHINNFTTFLNKKINIKIFKVKIFAFPKKLLQKKIIIPFFLLGFIFLTFSVKVVKDRLDLFNYKNVFVVWENQQEMRLDPEFKEYVSKSGQVNIEIAKYSIKHYFAHGIFEYIRMVNHVDKPFGMYYGQYIFNPYFKSLNFLGIKTKPFLEMGKSMHKQNVYTTFWGPFYLDFGIFGIPIALIFGALIKYIYIKARKGYLPYVLLYSYFAFIILGSMFLNLMIGSSIYIFNALLLILFLYKVIPQNIKFVIRNKSI